MPARPNTLRHTNDSLSAARMLRTACAVCGDRAPLADGAAKHGHVEAAEVSVGDRVQQVHRRAEAGGAPLRPRRELALLIALAGRRGRRRKQLVAPPDGLRPNARVRGLRRAALRRKVSRTSSWVSKPVKISNIRRRALKSFTALAVVKVSQPAPGPASFHVIIQ